MKARSVLAVLQGSPADQISRPHNVPLVVAGESRTEEQENDLQRKALQ